MHPTLRRTARYLRAAAVLTVVLTVVLGVVYPLAVTGVAQVALPRQANGSLVHDEDGDVVGSALLGQSFADADGKPLASYFQPRPSAAGDGYDGAASGGSNLGPESPELVADVERRRAQVAAFNGVPESAVPADAVTASGSGLDPDISPAYARIQIHRVAEARGLTAGVVRALVAAHTHGPDLGFLGESTVDVVELNLALDARTGAPASRE